MDRRSWLWRRKSSEKSLGETESSGSMSSYSERYSDDQEVLRASPNNDSPSHSQSPEVSSSTTGGEVHVTVKSLSEKLSAALLTISAKEDLVKQHMKVAEEAVSGWEKAETELVALKQQLEAAIRKNSSLEDRIGHLDGALKESVRQNRQSREEQEQKIHDVLLKKTREWESDKFEFENRITKLQIQLESAKSEASTSINYGLQSKLEAAEKENTALKAELFARTEDLRIRTLEKELSTRAAESASKQHLESIKKVAKLEAECRRLRAVPHKPISNSVCVESLTDSQSDSGERLLSVDNEPSCSDSWASALIAELDQFKIEKASERNLASSSIDIDLMDDFLEMERLVAMPEAGHGSSSFKPEAETNNAHRKMAELEEKVAKAENVKAELEMVLVDSRNQLLVAEDRLVVLQRHLDSANESKLATGEKMQALESQLEFARLEDRKLREKVYILQGQAEKEKTVSKEFAAKLESAEATIRALECELEAAHFEVNKLNEKVGVLEGKVQEEKSISVEFETKRKVTQCQFESARLEIDKLHEKAILLEVNLEAAEAAREALETDLKLAQLEVGELHDKMGLLENKIEEEKVLSAKLAARCQNLEGDLPWRKQEADVQIITSSNGEQKIKQEKELAISAGKLAECQKIIASLSCQLKSLSSLDDFMLEIEKTT